MLYATYSCFSGHSDKDLEDLVIKLESAKIDVGRMYHWGAQFAGLGIDMYWYSKGRDRATAATIRDTVEKRPQDLPVIIYLALHTEVHHDGRRVFLPADCPENLSQFQPRHMICYSELCRLLSARSSAASIVLLTESCYSDNIMQLPFRYFVKLVDGELQMREEATGCPGKDKWESKPLMVQFAATMPNEQAAWYESTGAPFTQAFCNYSVRRDLGFEKMVIKMQEFINKCRPSQTHVVYSSRKIQKDEDIWSALGLELKLPASIEPARNG